MSYPNSNVRSYVRFANNAHASRAPSRRLRAEDYRGAALPHGAAVNDVRHQDLPSQHSLQREPCSSYEKLLTP